MRSNLFADLASDLSVLLSAQVAAGRFSPGKLLRAWCFLFLGTALAALQTFPAALRITAAFLSWITAAAVAAQAPGIAATVESAFVLLLCSLSAAGFALLGGCVFPWGIFGAFFAGLCLRTRRHIRALWNIEVYLEAGGASASFFAMIDTGNRLRDNRTGFPVLIAERDAVQSILEALPKERFHALPYAVLGSTGEICCFAPDVLTFRFPGEARRTAPPCRVAVFPGRIPGFAHALAPPEFLLATVPRRPIQRIKRRFRNVVFKRSPIHIRAGRTNP